MVVLICDVAPFMASDCTAEDWTDLKLVQETTEVVISAFVDKHLKGLDGDASTRNIGMSP